MSLRIAFDIGGVLSRYPKMMTQFMRICFMGTADVYILTDMSPSDARKALRDNDADGWLSTFISDDHILSADWSKYGDACKAKVIAEKKIDILIDDRLDYLMGDFIGLMLAPRPGVSYYADSWKNTSTPAVMVPPEELASYKKWKSTQTA